MCKVNGSLTYFNIFYPRFFNMNYNIKLVTLLDSLKVLNKVMKDFIKDLSVENINMLAVVIMMNSVLTRLRERDMSACRI